MKIELLKTFVEVSRTRHFRLAAESLFITQAAVSARIKLLETDLNVSLFDRDRKNLQLTAEGHRLLKHAKAMIFAWQVAQQDVAGADNGNQQLTIGAMMSIWDIILQDWLNNLNQQAPEISVTTNTANHHELHSQLLRGLIDVAFVFEPIYHDDFTTTKIASVPLLLVSNQPSQPLIQALTDSFVMVDYGEFVFQQLTRELSPQLKPRHQINQPRVALNYILHSGGAAYLPQQMINEYLDEQLFIIEDAPILQREIYALSLIKSQRQALIDKAFNCFS
ncbi:LysR substrate-binding domain-containing protein [Algibacillus agarilyticus]|uniref:LysR substrate-binding domain-containing protein n=1 Tax=Algibacillus agarilyticus TaxID=2234133 RepID=UPI000DD0B935|nr:LysR substrate-binding domain-containing protein [Algibacillus agarilyticus]